MARKGAMTKNPPLRGQARREFQQARQQMPMQNIPMPIPQQAGPMPQMPSPMPPQAQPDMNQDITGAVNAPLMPADMNQQFSQMPADKMYRFPAFYGQQPNPDIANTLNAVTQGMPASRSEGMPWAQQKQTVMPGNQQKVMPVNQQKPQIQTGMYQNRQVPMLQRQGTPIESRKSTNQPPPYMPRIIEG